MRASYSSSKLLLHKSLYILDPLCIQVNVEGQIVSASDLQECLLHSVQCKTYFIIMMIIEKGNVTEAIFVLTVNRRYKSSSCMVSGFPVLFSWFVLIILALSK